MDPTLNKPPRGLIIWGALSLLCTMILEARLIWEMVVWTHERGAQMVGFSLFHTSPLPLILFLLFAPLSCVIFVLLAFVYRHGARKRHIQPNRIVFTLSLLAIASLLLLSVPYSTWQQIMIWTLGPGPEGPSLMISAASDGNQGLLDSYLSHGVDINARNHYEETALMNAAKAGNLVLARHLMDKGADAGQESITGENALTVAGEWHMLSFAREMHRRGARFVYSTNEFASLDSLSDEQLLRLFSTEDSLRSASPRYQAGRDSIFRRITRL